MKEKKIVFNLSEFIYKLKLIINVPIKYLNLDSIYKIIKDIDTVLCSDYVVEVVSIFISNHYDDGPTYIEIFKTKTGDRDYDDFLDLLIKVDKVLRSFPLSNSIISRIPIIIAKERLVINVNKFIKRYALDKYREIDDSINDYLSTDFSLFTINIIDK